MNVTRYFFCGAATKNIKTYHIFLMPVQTCNADTDCVSASQFCDVVSRTCKSVPADDVAQTKTNIMIFTTVIMLILAFVVAVRKVIVGTVSTRTTKMKVMLAVFGFIVVALLAYMVHKISSRTSARCSAPPGACEDPTQTALCNYSTNYTTTCRPTLTTCPAGQLLTGKCGAGVCTPVCKPEEILDCSTMQCKKKLSPSDCPCVINPTTGDVSGCTVLNPTNNTCTSDVNVDATAVDNWCKQTVCKLPIPECAGGSARFDRYATGQGCVKRRKCSTTPAGVTGFLPDSTIACPLVTYMHEVADATVPGGITCATPSLSDLKVACENDVNGCPVGTTFDGTSTMCVSQDDATKKAPPGKAGCRPGDGKTAWHFDGLNCSDDTIDYIFDVDLLHSSNQDSLQTTIEAKVSYAKYAAAITGWGCLILPTTENMNADTKSSAVRIVTPSSVINTDSDDSQTHMSLTLKLQGLSGMYDAPLTLKTAYRLVVFARTKVGGAVRCASKTSDPKLPGNESQLLCGQLFTVTTNTPIDERRRSCMPQMSYAYAADVAKNQYATVKQSLAAAIPNQPTAAAAPSSGADVNHLPVIPTENLPYVTVACVDTLCIAQNGGSALGSDFIVILAWSIKPVSAGMTGMYMLRKFNVMNVDSVTLLVDHSLGNHVPKASDVAARKMWHADTVSVPGSSWVYELGFYSDVSTNVSYDSVPVAQSSLLRTVIVNVPTYTSSLCHSITDSNMFPPFYVLDDTKGQCVPASTVQHSSDYYCLFERTGPSCTATRPKPIQSMQDLMAPDGSSSVCVYDGQSCALVHTNTAAMDTTDSGVGVKDTYIDRLRGNVDACMHGVQITRTAQCGALPGVVSDQLPVFSVDSPQEHYISAANLIQGINNAAAFGAKYVPGHNIQTTANDAANTFVQGSMFKCPLTDGNTAWGTTQCDAGDAACQKMMQSSKGSTCDKWVATNPMQFSSAMTWFPSTDADVRTAGTQCCNGNVYQHTAGSNQAQCKCTDPTNTTVQCTPRVNGFKKNAVTHGTTCAACTIGEKGCDYATVAACEQATSCNVGWLYNKDRTDCDTYRCTLYGSDATVDLNPAHNGDDVFRYVGGKCYRLPPETDVTGRCHTDRSAFDASCGSMDDGPQDQGHGWKQMECKYTGLSGSCDAYVHDQYFGEVGGIAMHCYQNSKKFEWMTASDRKTLLGHGNGDPYQFVRADGGTQGDLWHNNATTYCAIPSQ